MRSEDCREWLSEFGIGLGEEIGELRERAGVLRDGRIAMPEGKGKGKKGKPGASGRRKQRNCRWIPLDGRAAPRSSLQSRAVSGIGGGMAGNISWNSNKHRDRLCFREGCRSRLERSLTQELSIPLFHAAPAWLPRGRAPPE